MLVVDDGPENRELLQLVLTDTGLRVAEAENGQVAVDKARAQAFDVILMDMQMPVMDGHTATRTLRAEGLKMPIFALTANAMKGSEKAVMDAGCTGFLTKPVNIDQLLQTLANLLGGKRIEVSPQEGAVIAPAAAVETRTQPASAPTSESDITGALVSRLAGNERLMPAVRRFAGRLREQLDALDAAARKQDFVQVADLAHWLKGAGGTVGYDAFTEPAARLEQAAKVNSAGAVEIAIKEIRTLARRVTVDAGPAPTATTATATTIPQISAQAAPTEFTGPLVSRLASNERLVPAVRRFAGRLREQLDALDAAARNQDFVEVANLAHWLKGAGGTVGYDAFTEPAARLEQAAKASAVTETHGAIKELRALAERMVVPGQELTLDAAVR